MKTHQMVTYDTLVERLQSRRAQLLTEVHVAIEHDNVSYAVRILQDALLLETQITTLEAMKDILT